MTVVHKGNVGVLERRFGKLQCLFGSCMAQYQASCNGDPDTFVSLGKERPPFFIRTALFKNAPYYSR